MSAAAVFALYRAWSVDGTNDGALWCAYASARRALDADQCVALDGLIGQYDWHQEQRALEAARAERRAADVLEAEHDASELGREYAAGYTEGYARALREALDASNRAFARAQGWVEPTKGQPS